MDPRRRRVSEVMQTEVATLAPGERLDLADDVMSLGRVRHMPVLQDGRLVGLVSQRDLLAASLTKVLEFEPQQRRAFMRSVQVDEVMSRDVVSAAPETTLAEAAKRMLERRIGCLPVLDPDGTLMGLVTEVDLLRAVLVGGGDEEKTVEGERVSEFSDRFQAEMEALRRTRDELRVQVHLGAAEAKELWERVEKKWHEAESRARHVAKTAEEPLQDVREAASQLLEEIRDGYKKIRSSL
jgi:CBS domain-containing membrane protein